MSQQAAITLNTKVYSPSGSPDNTPGVTSSLWMDRSSSLAGGFSGLSSKFKTPKGAQTKSDWNITLPTVAVADTATFATGDVMRTSSASVSVWLSPNSTLAERTDLYLRLKDLIASAPFIAAVENLDPAWG